MGRDGAGFAFVVAGLVWEVVEEACFGIAAVIEGGGKVGGWSLNRVVVGVDCVAVGRRGFGLPVSMDFGSAFGKRSWGKWDIPVLALRA